jgi:hypothetical protein
VAARLEAHTIDGSVDLGLPEDLLDLLGQRRVLLEVDRFASEAPGLVKPLVDDVADDDGRRAEELGRVRAGEPDRAAASDVHG